MNFLFLMVTFTKQQKMITNKQLNWFFTIKDKKVDFYNNSINLFSGKGLQSRLTNQHVSIDLVEVEVLS